MGNDEQALATALKEARIGSKPFVSNTMTFKSERVLDLTNPAQLNTLGLTEAELMINFEKNNIAYQVPQIIGDIVRNKFDAIIFKSIQNNTAKNIGIILR